MEVGRKEMGVRRGETYLEAVVALAATCSAATGEVGGLLGGEVVCHCFCKVVGCLIVYSMFLTLIIVLGRGSWVVFILGARCSKVIIACFAPGSEVGSVWGMMVSSMAQAQ